MRTVQIGLERRRIDAEQQLAFFHVTSFAEGALQDDASDTGAYLRNTRRGNAPAQFAADRQRPRFDGFHANAGQWRLFFGDRGFVARAQRQRQCHKAEPGKQIV
ncbi:hypothetical protein D3C76_1549210 [compost metagenome]